MKLLIFQSVHGKKDQVVQPEQMVKMHFLKMQLELFVSMTARLLRFYREDYQLVMPELLEFWINWNRQELLDLEKDPSPVMYWYEIRTNILRK
jgi:hypothetical protein